MSTVLPAPALPPRGGNGACALLIAGRPFGHRLTGPAPPPRGCAGAYALSLLAPSLASGRHRVGFLLLGPLLLADAWASLLGLA